MLTEPVVTSLDQKAMTCRLQEVCSQAAHALAAPMAQSTALMAPTALGLFGASSHEPFHADGGQRSMAVTERSGKTPPQLAMVRQDSRTGRYTGRSTVLRLLYQEASKEGGRPRPGRGHGGASLVLLDRAIVAETVFVASGAVLIGRVTVSAGASIWYGAVLRADQDSIFVGERSNIQDGCVLNADPACRYRWARTSRSATTPPCTGASSRTRSSSAWARSCSTRRTWAVTIIAAGALLTEGQQVPEGVLVAGVPGKVRRELSEAERAAIERNAAFYVELAELHRRGGM
jgi:carbonic anhydrase/acetyltransferase-like protein (isoleucine patch superfamily)